MARSSDGPQRAARLLTMALAVVGGWMIAGTFFASQNHLVALLYGRDRGLDPELTEMITVAFFSAVLTPFLLFVALRFPVSRPLRTRRLLLLAAAAAAYAVVRACADAWLPSITDQPLTALEFRHVVTATTHTHFLMACIVIAITNLVEVQRQNAARRMKAKRIEADLMRAQLRHLQAELQPHFLFNTLNAAAALVESDHDAAAATLLRLADLLRTSLELGSRSAVPLREEIEFTMRYTALQEIRFGPRLRVDVSAPDEVLDFPVPPLLLQPLVENAIVHGIVGRPDGGRVGIAASAEGEGLRVDVRDDGPGADPAVVAAGGGLGISNTLNRLRWMYGDAASLQFSRSTAGFVVSVSLPRFDGVVADADGRRPTVETADREELARR